MDSQAIHIQAPEITAGLTKANATFAETGVTSKTVSVLYSNLSAANKIKYDNFVALIDTLAA